MKRSLNGFNLVEMAMVVIILVLLSSSAIITVTRRVDLAKGKRTVKDLESLAEKCLLYYLANNATWPNNLTMLSPDYLNPNFGTNPFGQNYYVHSALSAGIVVATNVSQDTVNKNMGSQLAINQSITPGWDQVRVYRGLDDGASTAAKFDKIYLYNETP